MKIKVKRKYNIFTVAILIAILFTTYVIISLKQYHDTHTWAVISVTGEIDSDTAETFSFEQEYQKDDTIKFENVTLKITHVQMDGTVTFSVRQGNLYDESGKNIGTDTISKDTVSNYKLDNGFASLTVTSNRYQ